ncbi:MAG: bifunctional aspartate kinase/diaminopimelate decarboxylase, partial [Gammaproteobacteria bacterium]|nr:bifunctional aspartate kinase/diaminopimelate decarboxylase [Gammaproteobacteria bacterium]
MPNHPGTDRWIVLKFGGSSVSQRERWDTIGELASARAAGGHRVLVVVSALIGVTNELAAIADGAPDAKARVDALAERHMQFAADLGLQPRIAGARLDALRTLVAEPRAAARPLAWQADVLAQGELLSSTLGAAYLRARGIDIGWCDARDALHAIALPNQSEWARRLSVACRREADPAWRAGIDARPERVLLTQGFIARHEDGGTAILGRGGSDTSAAYFGALLGADCV